MRSRFRLGMVGACAVLVSFGVAGCGGGSSTSSVILQGKAGDVPVGQWGDNNGSNLQVTHSGGELDAGCLQGIMTAPPILDADGTFDAVGTYHTLNTPPGFTRPAQFIGTVHGTAMMLMIAVNDGVNPPFAVGPFQLDFGKKYIVNNGTCP
jgi:hypothetical protein